MSGYQFGFENSGIPISSGQEITMPHRERYERKAKTTYVEVNSRDRNVKVYPSANQFRFRLFRPLKDIVSIRLVGGTIPTRLYNINTGWNSFTFLEGTTKYTITIPPGKYTYTQLATSIAGLINATPGTVNTYSAQFSTITGQMALTRTAGVSTFSILFLTGDYVDSIDANNSLQMVNSPAKLLGFNRADYSDNGLGFIEGPNAADIDFILNRIYVYLNHDNNQDVGTIDRSVGRHQPHAIVYMDETINQHKFLNKETFEPLYESYPAPISRISTLDIALRDEFDRLIELSGRDFTLLLEMCYLD
jgi:hypothetical protein